ncbi:hypothetical protein B6D52_02130 [Candidatus Parcubacteria bacterium 4484_255]|nr:MAG: hypothetical protein B6D52_02130 [Candidatus Parcubacteria bacterium 4484_255]
MRLFKRKFKKSRFNYLILNCFLSGILLLAIVISLAQVNAGVCASLEINELKQDFEALKTENESLLKEDAAIKSMENLQEISQELNMIEVARIDYLRPNIDTLAQLSW